MQDYVFYCVTSEEANNLSYGIKRGTSFNHENYFKRFLDIDSTILYDVDIPFYWCDAMEVFASSGHIMIANSAIEIENINERMYLFYLPSNPSKYQLDELVSILVELKDIDKVVRVCGKEEEIFSSLKGDELINMYLSYYNYEQKVKEKVMKS